MLKKRIKQDTIAYISPPFSMLLDPNVTGNDVVVVNAI